MAQSYNLSADELKQLEAIKTMPPIGAEQGPLGLTMPPMGVDFGTGGQSLPPPKKPNLIEIDGKKDTRSNVGLNFNPGGKAGAAISMPLDAKKKSDKRAGVRGEDMSPESAAALAKFGQDKLDKALAPPPKAKDKEKKDDDQTTAQVTPPPTPPPAPPTDPWGDGSDHGGIYHIQNIGTAGTNVFYNDGYFRKYDTGGNITMEHDYGSTSNFQSDERVKDVKQVASDERVKNLVRTLSAMKY